MLVPSLSSCEVAAPRKMAQYAERFDRRAMSTTAISKLVVTARKPIVCGITKLMLVMEFSLTTPMTASCLPVPWLS
jgi:hypothetical protein